MKQIIETPSQPNVYVIYSTISILSLNKTEITPKSSYYH